MPHTRFELLAQSTHVTLEQIFRAAQTPDLEMLVGFEWRGYNISPVTKLLGIQKFIKGFFVSNDGTEGYNIPVQQNGLSNPWLAKPTPEQPKRFAFFLVSHGDPDSTDHLYPSALLLDYGHSPRNPRYAMERILRDYLVQPDHDNPDLLLGKAYLAIGSRRIPSNFFVIERLLRTKWGPQRL